MQEKDLHSLVLLQRRVAKVQKNRTIIGVMDWGVQVRPEVMAEISEFAEIAIEEKPGTIFPWRCKAIFEGVTFFTMSDEAGFIDAGLFEIVALQAEGRE